MERIRHYADVDTPVPGFEWTVLDERQRVDKIIKKLEASHVQFLALIQVISAKPDGQVIVQMKQPLPVNERGPLLLDLEEYLKVNIDDALVVWLEPLGDRNSLRNLRGIEVKIS